MKIRIWPAPASRPAGKARILTRKIGNFPDKFSGTSGVFLGGLGLNSFSYDIHLSPSFEIFEFRWKLSKWEPKWEGSFFSVSPGLPAVAGDIRIFISLSYPPVFEFLKKTHFEAS